jgi:hypothetical protein
MIKEAISKWKLPLLFFVSGEERSGSQDMLKDAERV